MGGRISLLIVPILDASQLSHPPVSCFFDALPLIELTTSTTHIAFEYNQPAFLRSTDAGDNFIQNVLGSSFLTEEQIAQMDNRKLTQEQKEQLADEFAYQAVKEATPADLQSLSAERRESLSAVSDKLMRGESVILRVPNGTSNQVLLELFTLLPNVVRPQISFATNQGDSYLKYANRPNLLVTNGRQKITEETTRRYGYTLLDLDAPVSGVSESMLKWSMESAETRAKLNREMVVQEFTDGLSPRQVRNALENYYNKQAQGAKQQLESGIHYSLNDISLSKTQKEAFDEYVQNALAGAGNNSESYISIGEVSPRLVADLEKQGADISGRTHIVRDNDIRHIRNRHGIFSKNEGYNEYGVTTGDIQAIPYIVENYAEVRPKFVNGKLDSLIYALDYEDTTYYAESAVVAGEDKLAGKQMIKCPYGEIPEQYKDIYKERSTYGYLDKATTAVPEKYVQDVHQNNASKKNIPDSAQNVKRNFSLNDSADSRNLQAELHELQRKRSAMLEENEAYRMAEEQVRYAKTFSERVEARRALNAATAKINTVEIDQRISELRNLIAIAKDERNQRHRQEQEKYSDAKTAGYSAEPDTRLKSLDKAYEKAIKEGNTTETEKLVNQAAEAAMPKSVVRDEQGKLLRVYHYTNNDFTVFDRSRARTGNEMDGFFFAPDPDSTREYGDKRIAAYLNITNLAVDPVLSREFEDSGTLLRKKLASQGYDGIARTENGEIYEYMVFDPEQIKSADPIVYDDDGNVIPLSERFNSKNSDIRFSLNDSFKTDQAIRKVLGKAIDEATEGSLDINYSNVGYDTYQKFREVIPELRKIAF